MTTKPQAGHIHPVPGRSAHQRPVPHSNSMRWLDTGVAASRRKHCGSCNLSDGWVVVDSASAPRQAAFRLSGRTPSLKRSPARTSGMRRAPLILRQRRSAIASSLKAMSNPLSQRELTIYHSGNCVGLCSIFVNPKSKCRVLRKVEMSGGFRLGDFPAEYLIAALAARIWCFREE